MKFNDSLKVTQCTSGRQARISGIDTPTPAQPQDAMAKTPHQERGALTHVPCQGQGRKDGRSPALT